MCTIIAVKGRADHPLIVAANRDEMYARPSSEPRLVSTEPRVVAGVAQDREALVQ